MKRYDGKKIIKNRKSKANVRATMSTLFGKSSTNEPTARRKGLSGRFCCYCGFLLGASERERKEGEKDGVSLPAPPVRVALFFCFFFPAVPRASFLVQLKSKQTHAPAERVCRVRRLPGEDLVARLRAGSSGSASDGRGALLPGLALSSGRIIEVVGGGGGGSGSSSGIGSSCSCSSSFSTGVSIPATRRRRRHLQSRRARARIVMETRK